MAAFPDFTHFLCFVILRLILSSITQKFPTEQSQHEEVPDLFKIKWLKIDLVGTVFHFKNKILQKCFHADLGPNYFFSPPLCCSGATAGTASLGFVESDVRGPALQGGFAWSWLGPASPPLPGAFLGALGATLKPCV